MENQKPEALRLADKYEIEGFLQDHRFAKDHWCRQAAAELRHLHARNQELEAMLESIGAGGVSAQRVTQGKDHIEQPLEMVAAPVVLPEPVAAQIRHIKEKRWRTIVLDLYDVFAGDEYERRYIYTEQQVRELLAAHGITQKKAKQRQGETTMAINTDAERAALYREFCEWCNTVPYLGLDPRLHTHGGRIEDGGYISQT